MRKTNRNELKEQIPQRRTARPDFRLRGYGATDVGMKRDANEDSYLVLPHHHVWIVADGMGGHAGGQEASKLTVGIASQALLQRLLEAEEESITENPAQILEESIQAACSGVFDAAQAQPALTGMGSTVTLMVARGSIAWLGHVGDSRAYLIRDKKIHQITEDHSLVQEQVSAGLITPAQARVSMMRNIITRSIGYEREVKVDTVAVPLKKGDLYLLCSDGLTAHLEDEDLLEEICKNPPRQAINSLIKRANALGGEDNSTVIIVEVLGGRGRQREKRRSRSS